MLVKRIFFASRKHLEQFSFKQQKKKRQTKHYLTNVKRVKVVSVAKVVQHNGHNIINIFVIPR